MVPTSVGLLLGLTQLPEFGCEPGLVIAVCAESLGLHTHVFTKTDVQCHSVSEVIQV